MKSRKQQEARALRLVTGLRMNWIDDAGLDEEPRVRDHVVGHRKPLLRPDAKAIWRDFYDWITHHPTLLWRIDVGVIFDDGVIDSQRVVERVDLKLLAHACQPAIARVLTDPDNAHRQMVEIRFEVECLGNRKKTDADYGDFEVSL